jgi:ssDNA-binding Zn-finger/Zn-ribbon topoisomerase 1
MPAEPAERFNVDCPICAHELVVARAQLGKKGRCPNCRNVFPLVLTRTTLQAELGVDDSSHASQFQPRVNSSNNHFIVACPACEHPLEVPSTAIGKQGRCPQCSHVFLLQNSRENVKPTPKKVPSHGNPSEVKCPRCRQQLQTKPIATGQKGFCTICQQTFLLAIPTSNPATPTPTNKPKPTAPSEPTTAFQPSAIMKQAKSKQPLTTLTPSSTVNKFPSTSSSTPVNAANSITGLVPIKDEELLSDTQAVGELDVLKDQSMSSNALWENLDLAATEGKTLTSEKNLFRDEPYSTTGASTRYVAKQRTGQMPFLLAALLIFIGNLANSFTLLFLLGSVISILYKARLGVLPYEQNSLLGTFMCGGCFLLFSTAISFPCYRLVYGYWEGIGYFIGGMFGFMLGGLSILGNILALLLAIYFNQVAAWFSLPRMVSLAIMIAILAVSAKAMEAVQPLK